MDVAPSWRGFLQLLTQLAHEHIHRAVAAHHRIAPQTRIDLLALEYPSFASGQQLDQLELAPSQLKTLSSHESLEAIGADFHLAGLTGLGCPATGGTTAPPDEPLQAGDDFLGVAGLGNPVVGSQTQPADPLGHRGGARANDDAQLGQSST